MKRVLLVLTTALLIVSALGMTKAGAATPPTTYRAVMQQPVCFGDTVQVGIKFTRSKARPGEHYTLNVLRLSDGQTDTSDFKFRGRSTVIAFTLGATDDAFFGITKTATGESLDSGGLSASVFC